MKCYVFDWGWEGAAIVFAESEEEAKTLITKSDPKTTRAIIDNEVMFHKNTLTVLEPVNELIHWTKGE